MPAMLCLICAVFAHQVLSAAAPFSDLLAVWPEHEVLSDGLEATKGAVGARGLRTTSTTLAHLTDHHFAHLDVSSATKRCGTPAVVPGCIFVMKRVEPFVFEHG